MKTTGMKTIRIKCWRLPILVLLLFLAVKGGAVPVLPGQWQLLRLDDGTAVSAQLMGDELCHYWQTADGRCYVLSDDGRYVESQPLAIRQRWQHRQHRRLARARQQSAFSPAQLYVGERRGLLLLVDFPDCRFQEGHDQAYYQQLCNTPGFTSDEGYVGSIYDYFLAQSYGQFQITFDVSPVVTMPRNYAYYGKDRNSVDIDIHLDELIEEACRKGTGGLNLGDYDWDGDGEVDQVVIIYAGNGQAAGGGSDTIWPQEWTLSEMTGDRLALDDYFVDTYSCSPELFRSKLSGIGTLCHELSHCLGLPDMYDIYYSGNFGLDSWSLMDTGSYNGDGFVPAGFSAFERMSCGWLTPTVLTADTLVASLHALSQVPEAFLVSNDQWPDEFYLIENRQPVGWDAALPGRGMLVFHVDYDEEVWLYNEVNSTSRDSETHNDHQRCTIYHADNRTLKASSSLAGDAYPSTFNGNDSLTAHSQPAAMWYHSATGGEDSAQVAITHIVQTADSLIAFQFRAAPDPTVGLTAPRYTAAPQPIYTLSGQRAGTRLDLLPRGVYIIGYRKIIK